MTSFLQLLVTGLLQLFVAGVLGLFSGKGFNSTGAKFIFLFCLLFLFDGITVNVLNVELFAGQQWNWAGKAASVLWAVAFIHVTKLLSKTEAGWTLKVERKKSVFAAVVFLSLLRLGLRFLLQGFGGGYNPETALFQAALPGLSEELLFRGILLGLLNKAFPVKWTWLNTAFGWGLILVSVLFGLVHGLSVNEQWQLRFNSQKFFMTGGLGFALGFVKEKGKSLAPAVLLHNAWNLIAYWGR